MKFKALIAFLLLIAFCIPNAKLSSKEANLPEIKVGAYVDTYIATDNAKLTGDIYPMGRQFSNVNNKKDEIGLNIAQVTAKISYQDIIRSTFTLHAGDIPNIAWANEEWLIIQEANVGFQLLQNFWVDGGYFPTHIGGETLLPKNNWLSSQSIVTYFEPYYQAGFRFGYESEQFVGRLYVLNGAGIFVDNNANKTLGWYFGFNPATALSLSYAGVLGNEMPEGTAARTSMLHNICVKAELTKDIAIKGQLDYASLAVAEGSNNDDATMLGVSVQGRYQLTELFAVSARLAYLTSDNGIKDYKTTNIMNFTLGAEYKPSSNSFIRLEGGMLNFDEDHKYFWDGKKPQNSRMEIMLNMGVWFDTK